MGKKSKTKNKRGGGAAPPSSDEKRPRDAAEPRDRAAAAADDDEETPRSVDEEEDSEAEEDTPPPRKRRRTTTAAARRPRGPPSGGHNTRADGTLRTRTVSKFYGVSYYRRRKNWRAQYTDHQGKQQCIGSFPTQEDAGYAYNAAIRQHGLASRRKMNKVDSAGRLIGKDPATTSRYYGVSCDRRFKKFKARYTDARGKLQTIGYYESQEDAARAFNRAILEHGLQSIRRMNEEDSFGRLVEKAGPRND
mmetsp:Transcript_14451/g.44614  ORF Transcript_14451/g.44614 Transcript_14451/m.44614 type:complete len:249 (+) Transcript_14451:498-1244(+)